MIFRYDIDPAPALDAAVRCLEKDGLVVLPTDTVYGIGANAFSPDAVARLLAAKGRGRAMPPPVLVGSAAVLPALAARVPAAVRALTELYWPGPLTVILPAQPSLAWDLGDTGGTVALRMPDHEVACALLERFGPLAVTSANLTGMPPATTAQEAEKYFGVKVPVYLDGGACGQLAPSTIVDATGNGLKIVREGPLTREQIAAVEAGEGA